MRFVEDNFLQHALTDQLGSIWGSKPRKIQQARVLSLVYSILHLNCWPCWHSARLRRCRDDTVQSPGEALVVKLCQIEHIPIKNEVSLCLQQSPPP